ncbi:HtaA domain-containing protein [Aeromicrobium fastidiosum]|uniref:Htaa domain-containing protein n=1 Tax=Aeromicrobium fastidiosum TaxID=52699 RepID=A0A641AJL7_9ACTN|nr:HtaA domain-containing protein [Aeromicrobium fastidiosum]KAA1372944.1 hypothetical protein ESP62_017760 [Aeromicrobium fastidiosum]MBP2390908.1 hypothetical protein [Aeromicrobium fastidiosum]
MSITIARRAAAGLVSAAVVTSGLALAAPAQAAEVASPSLTWKISTYAAATGQSGQLADHSVAGGAVETDRTVTFPNGVGSVDPATGIASVTYEGSITMGGHDQYTITLAKPTVSVDAAGKGTISADVSWTLSVPSPTAGGPQRVNLTTFSTAASGADWTTSGNLRSLTRTPNWAGVQTPFSDTTASDAAGYGTTANRPTEGKSWDPAFITFLKPAGVGAFFYQTSNSNDNKAPSPFTATAIAKTAPKPAAAPAKITSIKRGSTTKPTTKKTGKTTVTLTSSTGAAVTGQVKVTFKQKGHKTKVKTAYVSTGSRVVTIPKLAKGKWTVSVKYLGNASFARTLTLPAGTFKVTK